MNRWGVLLLLSGCTCDPTAANGTALRIRVNFEPSVDITQVRFSATHDGGALFMPVTRPEVAAGRLDPGGSLLALLPDALEGQTVGCSAVGVRDGMDVASGSNTATVRRGFEVSCPVQLSPPEICSISCAGCCVGNVCETGVDDDACGSGGVACFGCSEGQRCVGGACICDTLSCRGGCCLNGTTCVDGGTDLACGRGGMVCNACRSGQHCIDGTCECDPSSCGGCCSGNNCLDGGSQMACGAGGLACSICAAGQLCTGGSCTCSATSCPGGCCNGNVCVDGGTQLACGTGGSICSSCQPFQTCTDGVCGCDGGPCAVGCNAQTCPGGCCSGGMCLANTPTSCGTLGVTCFNCVTATTDSCGTNNTCRCGNSPGPCPSGLHCVGGQCVCDETVCGGCCQGLQCRPGDVKQACGRDGGTCRNCSGGTSCVDQTCQ